MKTILACLFALIAACRAQDGLPYAGPYEPEATLEFYPPYGPHPEGSRRGNPANADDEAIHPTTCLICCKNKSPKFINNLCKDPKICFSKRCIKYMSKPRSKSRIRVTAESNARQVRQEEQLVPQEQSERYCRTLYPLYSDIVMKPVRGDPCSFTCESKRSPPLTKYKRPNGWTCEGDTSRVCWDGKCMDHAGSVEDKLCKQKFPTHTDVKALVKLSCQIACQTSSSGSVSYLLREDNDQCNPPDWLPRHIGIDEV